MNYEGISRNRTVNRPNLVLATHLYSVVVDEVLVADALEDPELLCDVPEGLVVVGLQWQLLHRHDVASLVVDRSVHLAEGALQVKMASSVMLFYVSNYAHWTLFEEKLYYKAMRSWDYGSSES